MNTTHSCKYPARSKVADLCFPDRDKHELFADYFTWRSEKREYLQFSHFDTVTQGELSLTMGKYFKSLYFYKHENANNNNYAHYM